MKERKGKKVTIFIFNEEMCQVFNGLATALSLLREGADVTVFFGSRGIKVVHKKYVKELKCLPDMPKEIQEKTMKKMEELGLPTIEELLIMLNKEGALLLACPLNKDIFEIKEEDLIEGVKIADPATFYSEIVLKSDFVLSF